MKNRVYSYFTTALQLIQNYQGNLPLHHYLKQYFSIHKKHGSKDRKFITHLCYCYYRLGKACLERMEEERLKISFFLCNASAGEWEALFNKNWIVNWSSNFADHIGFIKTIYPSFNIRDVFPFVHFLSDQVDQDSFAAAHFIQPDLFIRARPHRLASVLNGLDTNQITYQLEGINCLRLPNTTAIDKYIALNKDAVIQDYSSQRIGEFFKIIQQGNDDKRVEIWDCCAASGGKSILAYDNFLNVDLTVSDIRASILDNLKKRLQQAKIKSYRTFVADVTSSQNLIHQKRFDLIICDAPCSGSGTWSRTPENMYFFKEERIAYYSELQKKIVNSVIPAVKKGGYFLYITCSVYKQENEDIRDYILHQFNLALVKEELFKGYCIKADSMYAVLFKV